MTARIVLKQYGQVEAADLALPPGIIFVGGRNNAGKSTVLRAVGTLLAQMPLPPGMKKGEGEKLVRRDKHTDPQTGLVVLAEVEGREGVIRLGNEGGALSIAYPAGETAMAGENPPSCDPVSAGLIDLMALTPQERIRYLTDALKAEPSETDLAAALTAIGLKGDVLASKLAPKLKSDGWDTVHAAIKDSGATFKGEWRQITGENYGSEKAQKYRPAGYTAGMTRETAELAIQTAKAALETALGAAGANAAETERLQKEVGREGEVAAEIEFCKGLITTTEKQLADAKAKREGLPPAVDSLPQHDCPACGAVLFMQGTKLIEASDQPLVDGAELKKRRMAIADADGLVSNRTDALSAARQRLARAEAALEAIETAKTTLEATPAVETDPAAVASAREKVQLAEAALAAVVKFEEAEKKRKKIEDNQAIVAVLAPTGLRKTKLGQSVHMMNTTIIEPLLAKIQWERIELTEDLTVTANGLPYEFLGESARFRVDAVLQCAFAILKQSRWLVIDRLDVMTESERATMIRLVLNAAQFNSDAPRFDHVVIGCSYDKPEKVPRLPLGKIPGTSYWADAGVIVPLDDALPKQEAA